ncbi:uncharacterized protein [Diadema setosum]|uniref:uncharacterized protein n=1 Tax=Diadema setosum TaxID=31175 RepID=UPI003B3A6778
MAEKQSSDVDSVLKAIARDIPDDEAIEDLGKELGFTVPEIGNYMRMNSRYHDVTNKGTVRMLRRWRHRVSPSSLRSDLREALMRAKLVWIAETHLPSGNLPSLSAPSPPSLQEKQVQRCKEDLKEYYRESRRTVTMDPLNFMDRVSLDDIYTDLSLIDRGNMRKTPITYEDILAYDESGKLSKHLLIQGEGGVGKTTLCAKIAWDWCQGKILQDLDLVIVIPLRDVTDGKSIGAILKTYLSDSNAATPDQIDGYISTNLNKILLAFDGFDEFREDIEERSNSEVIRILALEQYKSCKVIVTTRPWRSHAFKMTRKLAEMYTFISVEGFSKGNLATYISRYFQISQKNALGESLISFMQENDIIRSDMAPFPIYCAMLCLMWEYFTDEKRKELTKLQTFSEIFGEMISFLKYHYASKACERLHYQAVAYHLTEAERAIQDISEIALNGLLQRTLSFPEEHFRECQDAMETCCKVGVLTIDKYVPREKRRHGANSTSLVQSVVSFPHKLFQEYVAGVYVVNVYVSDHVKYQLLKQRLLYQHEEFCFLLYFASALGKELGLDIMKDLPRRADKYFCIDVAFECHTEEAARTVGKGWEEYQISSNMPEHTKSGVAFMMRYDQAKSISIDEVNCGKTTSRELAEGMCSSSVLRKVTITNSKFHADFYKIIGDKTSTCQLQDVSISLQSWDDGSQHHSPIGGNLAKWAFSISSLSSFSLGCPYLDGDFVSTAIASASSCQIQDLSLSFHSWDESSQHQSSIGGHLAQWVSTLSSLSSFCLDCPYLDRYFFSTAISSVSSCQIQDMKVSLEYWDDCSQHQSSIGGDLAQWLFTLPSLSSFSLDCPYLDGDFLSTAIDSLSSCQIQDLELSLDEWCGGSQHQSWIGRDLAQWVFTLPTLSSFSLRCRYPDGDFLSIATASASSCQIKDMKVSLQRWDFSFQHAPTKGGDFAQWIFTLPSLSKFSLECPDLDGDFLSTAIASASSCQIHELSMTFEDGWMSTSAAAATDFAKFLCRMPHLERADISCRRQPLPETFFTGITSQQAICKLEDITINGKPLNQWLGDK